MRFRPLSMARRRTALVTIRRGHDVMCVHDESFAQRLLFPVVLGHDGSSRAPAVPDGNDDLLGHATRAAKSCLSLLSRTFPLEGPATANLGTALRVKQVREHLKLVMVRGVPLLKILSYVAVTADASRHLTCEMINEALLSLDSAATCRSDPVEEDFAHSEHDTSSFINPVSDMNPLESQCLVADSLVGKGDVFHLQTRVDDIDAKIEHLDGLLAHAILGLDLAFNRELGSLGTPAGVATFPMDLLDSLSGSNSDAELDVEAPTDLDFACRIVSQSSERDMSDEQAGLIAIDKLVGIETPLVEISPPNAAVISQAIDATEPPQTVANEPQAETPTASNTAAEVDEPLAELWCLRQKFAALILERESQHEQALACSVEAKDLRHRILARDRQELAEASGAKAKRLKKKLAVALSDIEKRAADERSHHEVRKEMIVKLYMQLALMDSAIARKDELAGTTLDMLMATIKEAMSNVQVGPE